jgi:predicted Zn-dependent protease
VRLPKLALRLCLATAATTAVGACAKNPATGDLQLSLVSEAQEIELGRGADPQIVAALGLYPDDDVQAYVQRIGKDLAASSERPDLPWTFRVLDTDVVNAFALPGGFIYVTRGLMAHLDNEAELAGVLGHEIGHVTARHSVERLSQAQLAGLGLGVGMIFAPRVEEIGSAAEAGLGLLFLKFGRDDERESDDLGVRYMVRDGYDPREIVSVFETLGRVSQAEGQGAVPTWLATHPAPAERVARLKARVQEIAAGMPTRQVEREAYLAQIDGMTYGEDPRAGFFEGQTFHHPGMAFSIDLPSGWQTINEAQAVGAVSPAQDAVVQLSLSGRDSPRAAAEEFFAQQGLEAGAAWSEPVGGGDSVARTFRATDQQGTQLAGVVAFVEHGGQVFQILGISAGGAWDERAGAIAPALASFRPLTDPQLLRRGPDRIDVVELPERMTVAEFSRRYPSTVDVATVARINQVRPSTPISAGTELKRVVSAGPGDRAVAAATHSPRPTARSLRRSPRSTPADPPAPSAR